MESATATHTCYRHPDRQTGVSCSNCGRPICPDCMTPTSVGMRCPECASQKTQVRTIRSVGSEPRLAYALIAVNVIVFLAEMGSGGADTGGRVFRDFALLGGAMDETGQPIGIDNGEWYRVITGGFLHGGLLHLFFNMFFVYFLGQMLEPAIGKLRFGLIYGVSLLGGSFGALLLTDPNVPTVGASGAAFGLLAAGIIGMRARGMDPWQSGLGMTLILNLGITFLIPGISIGGHLGGLVAGGILGWLIFDVAERRPRLERAALAACGAVGVAAFVASVAVAQV